MKDYYKLLVVMGLLLFQLLGCSSEPTELSFMEFLGPGSEVMSLSGLGEINYGVSYGFSKSGQGLAPLPDIDLERLNNLVASKLKDANIQTERIVDEKKPDLHIRVKTYQDATYPKDLLLVTVEARLNQKVAPLGLFKASLSAPTWSTDSPFLCNREELIDRLDRHVIWVTERFIDDYKKAN